MKTTTVTLSMMLEIFAFLFVFNTSAFAQDEDPWEDGTVWHVDFVKIHDGYGRDYLKNLREGYYKQMEAAKEAGLILDYKILVGQNYGENDWDMMLLTEYENYAALDKDDEWDALSEKVFQETKDERQEASIARNELRTLLGGKMVRELKFK